MEISKLKVELYDVAAIVLPGIFFIAELWAVLFGVQSLASVISSLKGTELTLVVLASFGAGNLVQEGGNAVLTTIRGARFFKQSRDAFWTSPEAEMVRAKIKTEGACELEDVDAAFEYCLTRIGGLFLKRDIFLAISDFSRSLWLLAICFVVPLGRVLLYPQGATKWKVAVAGLLGLYLAARLSWLRMVRFRAMTEKPVFTIFLACGSPAGAAASPKEAKDE